MGVMRMPAIAPIAADTANEKSTMRRVSTPMSRAARRLAAVAITALPSKLRSMNSQSYGGRHDDGDEPVQRQRNAGKRHENRRHPAQHDEFALGEIDNVRRL